ncbi:hypothetical protein JCM3775_001570 [Rhodotorula graminis]|uniref:Uncharacterized protein n=1 Tax=Rhodotorula graminis (strain WP1) TaxID=578459 RepID=A0A0N8PZ76_RHOGW|nr:uncharacterized protein RHOBADRAFT_56585 [Rhodotorula graminis WP1]KPV71549.1 hypothetical protein RHOBADRAFT_56585 [Rhodotorula graminis WP1]
MSALDEALLREDLAAPVTIASLISLSPAQLALAAFRPDLDFLTRQRAYTEFLLRRSMYRESAKRGSHEQPILEMSLNFERPASPSSMSSSELALLQFNPRCITAREAGTAQHLFFERARAKQAEDDAEQRRIAQQILHVERCDLQYLGGVPSFAKNLLLEIKEDGLVMSPEGTVMVQIESQHITSFHYVTTVDGASGRATDCTLKVEASEGVLVGPDQDTQIKLVVIKLGRVSVSDPSFEHLRSTVAKWSAVEAFPVHLVETRIVREQPTAVPPYPTPPPRATSLPDDASSSSQPRSRSTTATSPVPLSNKRPLPDEFQQQPQSNKRARTAELCQLQASRAGLWRFVGDLPEDPLWHPGHLVRQLALLRAIMPKHLAIIDYSPDDLALLSRAALPSALPILPRGLPPSYPSVRHRAPERLALEHTYRKVQRLEVDTTRLVLLTDAYPEVRLYAQTVAKTQLASDTLKQAYATVELDLQSRIARQTPETKDPLESLLDLVRKMRDSLDFCCRHFYHAGSLIRTVPPSLTHVNIGMGPLRRFEGALMAIVAYEEMAGAVG